MAKAYLSAKSFDLLMRTWADVMEHYSVTGVESTRKRKATAFRSHPFAHLRGLPLLDTEAAHLLAVLEHERAGNSAHHYLRRLHNYALHLGWLLMPVMADAAWPEVRKRKFIAITEEEHRRIVDRERNVERKLYYEMLWETGGAQTDIASLHADQVDLKSETIHFRRRKLAGKESGGESLLRIGPCTQATAPSVAQRRLSLPERECLELEYTLERVLPTLPDAGDRRTQPALYRYAWAQRARAAGMPEREAMNHLGHESRAIHAAYAGGCHGGDVAAGILRGAETQERGAVHHSSLETARRTPSASKPNRPIKATAGGGLEAKRCRMADDAPPCLA
ncbi:MAG: hypothetical protein WDO13_05010 [Verrucomicrobiota bacterium]